VAAEGHRFERFERVGSGLVLIAKTSLPDHWIVTWLPPENHPDWPGFIFDSNVTLMPTDGGADAILAWARRQPWAQPESE
jgi:hypothetical protein